MLPYPQYLGFLSDLAIDLGGAAGSLGTQKERSVFKNNINKAKVAPVICYESIYGEFVTDYIKKGANIIFVITNDGWWGDTPGYRQHLSFSKLRAIENRRSIARSANTGISCFINQRGDILQKTQYWEKDVIKGKINLNNKITYYTIHGDFIGRISGFLSLLIITMLIVKTIRKDSFIK
jgi:apolipoprotein N-acyltransferase